MMTVGRSGADTVVAVVTAMLVYAVSALVAGVGLS